MQHSTEQHVSTIAIAGLGSIGQVLVRALDDGMTGLRLVAVARPKSMATLAWLETLRSPVQVVAATELAALADIVIECASAQMLLQLAEPVLRAGKKLVVLSASALLTQPQLIALARRHRAQILVPSGALGGLDMLAAMAQGQIHAVKLITSKPPAGLRGVAYLTERGIDVDQLSTPLCVFAGTARVAAGYFPANLNVAAALSLAGIGADRTMVELWVAPHASCNRHTVDVVSDAGQMQMSIAATPSRNPRTSGLAAQSVLALLRKLHAPLCVGL